MLCPLPDPILTLMAQTQTTYFPSDAYTRRHLRDSAGSLLKIKLQEREVYRILFDILITRQVIYAIDFIQASYYFLFVLLACLHAH